MCGGASLSTSVPAEGAGPRLDEARLREFLQESHYTPGAVVRESSSGQAPASSTLGGKACSIRMVHPRPGYQGDTTSSPRLRRADASASFSVSGAACVEGRAADMDGGGEEGLDEGERLVEGMELRVLVDGVEEATTTAAAIHLTLPDLPSGNHMVLAQVVMPVEEGRERALVALSAEVVILQDIEILFPSNEFVFERGHRIVLAIGISPTALEHFCAPPSHMFAHCHGFDAAAAAVGVLIELNDVKASEFDMKAEDGDDGRRVYHVDLTDMPVGDYLLGVTLLGPGGAGDTGVAGGRRRIGEPSFVSFEIAECARNGRHCGAGVAEEGIASEAVGESGGGGGGGDGGGDAGGARQGRPNLFACAALAKPLCVPGGGGDDDDGEGEGEAGLECSGHGACVRGVCLCRGDWIGAQCEHSLLRDALYLPQHEPATWPGRCEQVPRTPQPDTQGPQTPNPNPNPQGPQTPNPNPNPNPQSEPRNPTLGALNRKLMTPGPGRCEQEKQMSHKRYAFVFMCVSY